MQYNTALGFALLGFALVLPARWRPLAALPVTILGGLTLSQYGSGVDLGIDELLMEAYITTKSSHPGRMAPNSALCFVVAGLALLSTYRPARTSPGRIGGWLGAVLLALATAALSGYVAGVEAAYGWGSLTRMALHTAAGFVVVGAGVVAAAWELGPDIDYGRRRWLPGSVFVTLFGVAVCAWQAMATVRQVAQPESTETIGSRAMLAAGFVLAVLCALVVRSAQLERARGLEYHELASIVRWSGDSIFSVDPEGRVRAWNGGAEKLYGWRAEDILGQPVEVLVPPEQRDKTHELLQEVRKGRAVVDHEAVRIRADGSEVEVSLTISPVIAPDGRFLGISSVSRDITNRKEVERALAARTRALQRSNEELQQFTSVASHDLKAPLRKAAAFAGRLEDSVAGKLTSDEALFLDRTLASIRKMQKLVEDLLALARSGSVVLGREPVDLNRILARVVESLEVDIEKAGASVEIDPLGEVRGDAGRIEQVFQNLLVNSIKYRSPERPCRIRVVAEAAPADRVRVVVRDNGRGMTAEECARAFDPFVRFVGVSEVEGSGIGLAICRRLVEKQGGSIECEPQEVGVRFVIEMPSSRETTRDLVI